MQKVTVNCKECGKEELVTDSRSRRYKTCSRECSVRYEYKIKNFRWEEGLKLCTKCNEHKPLETDFRPNVQSSDGKHHYCNSCFNEQDKNRQQTLDRKIGTRKRALQKYGLTLEDYQRMCEDRENRCDICKKDCTATLFDSWKGLVVDHCHTTGVVRGLLCSNCNTAIGLMKDNTNNLTAAITYLNNTK